MQLADRGFGLALAVRHIGGDGLDAVRGAEVGERAGAALAGGDLRLQIGDVERGVARGERAVDEMRRDRGVAEMPVVDEQDIVEDDAFVFDAAAVRRHRSGRDAAKVGVMAARGDEEGGGGLVRRRTPA